MTRPTHNAAGSAGGDLLTPAQAAAFLRVTMLDLLTAARNGQVPYRGRGRRMVFSRTHLLAAMRTAATSGAPAREVDDA